MSASPPDIIDEHQFQNCLTGDHEIDLELLQMALAQCEDTLGSMAGVFRSGDAAAWKMLAHRSRGSSSMMGFNRVAKVLDEAEHGPVNPETMASCLDAFPRELAALRSELEGRGYAVGSAASVRSA